MTGSCIQNPLVFVAGFVTGIIFSIDQSLCCCVDIAVRSSKLATVAKLLVTLSFVAVLAGGIASGISRSKYSKSVGDFYPVGVAFSGNMDPITTSTPTPTIPTTTAPFATTGTYHK